MSRRKILFVLFGVALAFRVFVLLSLNDLYLLSADGTGYHNMAVNFAQGNGLSGNNAPPFYPTFFREPGYPAFLASGYKVWALFGGKLHLGDWRNPDIYNSETRQVTHDFGEIRFIKFYQAFFDSFSVLILFLILCFVLPSRISFIIALGYALFWPVSIHCNYILRESFQTLVLLLMNYFFVKGLFSGKKSYYIPFALFWAISNITLQITLIPLVAFVFLYIWYIRKKISTAFYETGIAFCLMMLFMLPWLLHVYSYYPDIRIAKTGGCSLTYEWKNWASYQYKLKQVVAKKKKMVANDDLIKIESISIDHKDFSNFTESFEMSFNGYFASQSDSMKAILSKISPQNNYWESLISKTKKVGKHSLYNFWVKRNWGLRKPVHQILREKNFAPFFLYGFSIMFGAISFVGLLVFYKQVFPILLVFVFFWAISYIIGSEIRRFLPSDPYVFSFGILGAVWLYNKLPIVRRKLPIFENAEV